MHGLRLVVANHKAENVFINIHGFSPKNLKQQNNFYKLSEREIKRLLGLYRKTKVVCSCSDCGNPRKLGELTLEEIRAKKDAREQLLELLIA